MSILNAPQSPEAAPEVVAAEALVEQARDLWLRMVMAFNEGAALFWAHPDATPQQIADALGERGVEVFTLHGKLGALLAEVSPASIAAAASLVGSFTYGEDGRVTITSVPTPPDLEPLSEPALPE